MKQLKIGKSSYTTRGSLALLVIRGGIASPKGSIADFVSFGGSSLIELFECPFAVLVNGQCLITELLKGKQISFDKS